MQITFNANDKQLLALQYLDDQQTTEIGFGGGAGGGKSYLGVFRVRKQCMKYPGSRYFFGRKELKKLKETTLISYYKFCNECGITKPLQGTLNNQQSKIIFPNGSQILLLDLDYMPSDPLYHRIGSLELTGGFIDEAQEIDRLAITVISTRVGRWYNEKYGLVPKILETFNPDKGHVYERYYLANKKNKMPVYRKFIPALARDNPRLDKNYIEQLEKADIVTKQRLLYGNFEYDDDPLKIFTTAEIYDAFTNPNTSNGKKYIVCDVARFGQDSIRIGIRDNDDLINVYTYRKQGTDKTVEDVKKLETEYKVRRSNICIDDDGVGGGVSDGLRGCVRFINNATPYQSKKSTYLKNNYANLKTQCAYELKRKMEKGLIRLYMTDEDKDTFIQEAENLRINNPDKGGKIKLEAKEDMKRIIGRSPDLIDMVIMKQVRDVRNLIQDDEEEENMIINVNRDEMLT